MVDLILSELPPVYRVALGSAQPNDREAFGSLFALDARLGRAVAEASEPIIAQVKLAWWRDRFAEKPADWPIGEPLLAQIAPWGGRASSLGKLVDGWEELVAGDALTAEGRTQFIEARKASWRTVAAVVGVSADAGRALEKAAQNFTLADLGERGFGAPGNAISVDAAQDRLPRQLRPFAVLGNLGRRSVLKSRPMLDGMPSLALALRTGLTGL